MVNLYSNLERFRRTELAEEIAIVIANIVENYAGFYKKYPLNVGLRSQELPLDYTVSYLNSIFNDRKLITKAIVSNNGKKSELEYNVDEIGEEILLRSPNSR